MTLAIAATQTVYSMSILPHWLDPEVIVRWLGAAVVPGVCFIIFAECGLLVGFFLPGDSLLFTAGLFAAQGAIATPIWLICVLTSICAFLGNVSGYYIGYKSGPMLFDKPDSKLFKREYVEKTHEFFERYGARAIIMARFVPIVRTFITAFAGVGRMDKRKFFTYSAIGAVLWAAGVTILGALLGRIAFVREHIDLIAIVIVLISVIPIGIEYLRGRKAKQRTATRG